jgi:GntR family transcriptional regulator
LRVKIGTPLLKVDRIAYAPDKQPVEWRVSLCQLKNAHYLARMGA